MANVFHLPRLEFDEATHAYRLDGVRMPSVTQILAPIVSFAGIPAHVLEAKRDLGTRVHMACQLDAEQDLDEDTVEDDVAPYLLAWRKFVSDTGAEVLATEQRVYSLTHRYAGTLDLHLLLNREQWVVDIKTAIAMPRAVGPQTAAYWQALGHPDVKRRGCLRLRNDGRFVLDALTDPNDWPTFLACLTLYNWNQKQ